MVLTKKTNIFISLVMLTAFIVVSFFNVTMPTAYAATGATGESESETLSKIQIIPANGDTLNCVKLDGRPQLCRFAYYVGKDDKGNEKNYPTYCVEPNLEGVNTLGEYEAVLTETVKHPRVYGAVLNGYPYKTLAELGVNTNLEGYYATRNVVWSLVKGWQISQWTSDGSAEGNRVLAAMQQIYAAAKDYTELPIELMVKVTKNREKAEVDVKDNQYVSTTYTITANKELIENISVELEPNPAVSSAKIVDMDNNLKSTFSLNDDFKVIVSKTEADTAKDLKLDLRIKVKGKDNAIFYAKSQNPNGQDYYAARDPIAVKDVATTFLYGAAEPDTPDNPDNPPITPTPNTKGTLTIHKLDASDNRPLAGAQFNVIKNGTVLGVYATNSQGKIEIPINTDTRIGYVDEHDGQVHYRNTEKNKVFDSYTITELDPPFGYLLNPVNTQVASTLADGNGGVLDDSLVVTFKNDKYGELLIQKTDADTNAPLKGAIFRVTYLPGADDNYHYTSDVTTDGTGSAALSGLKPGSYSVQEIAAPSGYILEDKLETITITAGKNVTYNAVNRHKPGLEITKLDANNQTAVAGVTFNIKGIDNSYDQDFTTGTDGKITLENLEAGSYQVTEVSAPPEYKLDPANTRSIELAAGQSVQLVFYNEQIPHLEILKLDAEDGTPISGVTFNIRGIDSTYNQDFITNADGKIILDTLEEGSYQITETAAPPEYKLDPANTRSIELQAGKSIELVFYNEKLPYLEINKIDKVSKQPLANVTFTISEKGGTKIGDYTTDAQGKIRLEELPEGWYTLVEKAVPDGVILDTTPHDIYVEAQKSVSITLENSRKPKLIIQKEDSVTHSPVANAKFQVWYAVNGSLNGELQSIGVFFTDGNGRIDLGQVEPGWYRLTEIEAPNGYTNSNLPSRDVFMAADQDQTITFENTPKSALTVKKIDADTGEPLSGAKFRVRYLSGTSGTGGTVIGEYTTGVNGSFIITGLEAGTYIIEETQAPANYLMTSDTAKTAYLSGKEQDVVTVEFTNKKISGLLIKKLDSQTKQPLAGAEFKITDSSGAVVGSSNGLYTTDADGYIHLPDIEPGTYVAVEQKAPAGYLLDQTPQTVKLQTNETHILTFYNQPIGGLLIKKMDAQTKEPLADVIFQVTTSDGTIIGTNENGEYRTDENGYIAIDSLKPDTYIIKEIKAKNGYILDDTPKTVVIKNQETYTVEFFNHRESALIIQKIDAESKKPLSGAIFLIEKQNGERLGEYETDSNGNITLKELPPDWYVLTEIKAPNGYELDSHSKTVEVKQDTPTTITFTNKAKASLQIQKVDEATGAPLSGAKFKITKQNGEYVGEYTTDSSGLINIAQADSGWYVVTETKAPNGYVLDETPKNIEVKTDVPTKVTFSNKAKASLQIQKVDEVTGAPLSGAKFKVTKQNGEYVGEYTTDSSGLINIAQADSGWYVVTETKAPNGYVLDETPKNIEVKTDVPTKVTFSNKAKAALQIQKVDEVTGAPLSGAKFKVTKQNGEYVGEYETDGSGLITIPQVAPDWYVVTETKAPEGHLLDETPKTVEVKTDVPTKVTFTNKAIAGLQIKKVVAQTGEPLSGVKFEITKLTGEKVGTYTTDKNGIIFVSLEPDWYVVKEIYAPKGYKMDASSHNIEIKPNEPTILEISNQQVSGIRIHKVDADTGEGIYGVRFLLKDDKNNIIGEYSTDDDGYIDLEKELPDGKYKLEEIEAADGYIKDNKVKTITVRNGYTEEILWKNKAIKGQIQIIKKSADYNELNGLPAGTLLSGAVFEIINPKNNRVLDKIITDSRGIAASKALPLGRYLVKEVQAPDGYGLNPNTYEVELKIEGDIVRFEVLDSSIQMGVSVKKEGNREVIAGSQMYYNLSQIANLSNTTLSNFYLHDAIPTDAVNLEKVITGTYNQRLHYNIFYKTNFHDYRTLGSNLLTNNNYEFATTSHALGLMTGEYVTDIRFDFGNVQPGFLEKEQPILVVNVKSNLPSEYRIVNKADVGGRYNNEWQTAKDSWVTIVYGQAKPQKLPQTGY